MEQRVTIASALRCAQSAARLGGVSCFPLRCPPGVLPFLLAVSSVSAAGCVGCLRHHVARDRALSPASGCYDRFHVYSPRHEMRDMLRATPPFVRSCLCEARDAHTTRHSRHQEHTRSAANRQPVSIHPSPHSTGLGAGRRLLHQPPTPTTSHNAPRCAGMRGTCGLYCALGCAFAAKVKFGTARCSMRSVHDSTFHQTTHTEPRACRQSV